MFVGHGLLAFAIVGLCARRFGIRPRQALVLGVVAALFGTLPDVDILYGPIGLLGGVSGLGDAVDTFWATGNVVHRGPTHSLLVGVLAASAFALASRDAWAARAVAGALLATLVVLTATASSGLDAAVVAAFLLAGLVVVGGVARRLDLSAQAVFLTALVGLLSHPFGDLLTGSPPDFFYPLDVVLVPDRLSVHPDETLHLLGSFGVELAVIWFALLVYFSLTDRSIGGSVDRRAALGACYGAAVFVLPAPTIDTASPFVFSVLSLGFVGALPTRRTFRPELDRVVATGLAAVTFALLAYSVAYLWL